MHDSKPMTRRQARLLMALGMAILLTQVLCTAILVSRMDRAQKVNETPRVVATDTTPEPSSSNDTIYTLPAPQVTLDVQTAPSQTAEPADNSLHVFTTEPAPTAPGTTPDSSGQ